MISFFLFGFWDPWNCIKNSEAFCSADRNWACKYGGFKKDIPNE